jgi:hypothetical protein
MPVIGYFSTRSPDAEAPLRVPFLKALEGSGFTAGRNVTIEYRKRLPAICPYRDYVEAGGLMAYAVDLAELLRRMV